MGREGALLGAGRQIEPGRAAGRRGRELARHRLALEAGGPQRSLSRDGSLKPRKCASFRRDWTLWDAAGVPPTWPRLDSAGRSQEGTMARRTVDAAAIQRWSLRAAAAS